MAKRRRSDSGDGCDLTNRQRTWLLSGRDLSHFDADAGSHGLGGFSNHRAGRLAWEKCRDELIAFWIQDPATWVGKSSFTTPAPGGPGSRPWGFWRFEATAARVVVEQLEPGRKNELSGLGWFCEKAWKDFFGRPAGDYAKTESESSYLLRHRLFLPGEESSMRGPPEPKLVE